MQHPGETLKSQASPGGTGGCQYLTYVKRKGQLGLVKWIFLHTKYSNWSVNLDINDEPKEFPGIFMLNLVDQWLAFPTAGNYSKLVDTGNSVTSDSRWQFQRFKYQFPKRLNIFILLCSK